ncbi:MAG TPA: hypothetical protein VKR06_23590, partial [Ktedonosporobacter sp.]|nr:hypothetical protein [Ktedonosporobacter sp.]
MSNNNADRDHFITSAEATHRVAPFATGNDPGTRRSLPEPFAHIFAQIPTQDVEQFHKAYELWTLQKRIQLQQLQIATLQQHIIENAAYLQQTTPSAIALATLAQLQSHGVNDIDLLDRMLDRGESWLDNTMQLLERCEELDMIQGDYTQWCEHALEGAYNWIASMPEASESPSHTAATTQDEQTAQATAELLLQKLLSDDSAAPSALQSPNNNPSPTPELSIATEAPAPDQLASTESPTPELSASTESPNAEQLISEVPDLSAPTTEDSTSPLITPKEDSTTPSSINQA